jgi:hypothetical protein
MPKFTFIGEHTDIYGKPDGTKVTYEFNVDTLDNVLEHADLFIRGCGYYPQGVLDYIVDEPSDQEWYNEEFQTPNEPEQPTMGHSSFFYDTERNK